MEKKKSKIINNNINNSTNFCDILSIQSNPEDLFTLLYPIGRGEFCSVYKAMSNITNQIYAIKIVDFSKHNNKENNDIINYNYLTIQQESNIMKSMNTSNYIVKYYGSYFSRKSNTLWLILEYCSSGSVKDLMFSMERTYSEVEVATIIEMVLHGLIFIHNNNTIHRDIKGVNILLSEDGYAKINDFGIGARISSEKYRSSKKGSSYWMSPQVASNSEYDFKTDIWSLGITCIELIEGEPPFSELNPEQVEERIARNPLNLNDIVNFNEHTYEFKNFIEHCLEIDQEKRYTAQELLKHEFIQKFSKGRKYMIDLIKKHEADIEIFRFESEKEYQNMKRKEDNSKTQNNENNNGSDNSGIKNVKYKEDNNQLVKSIKYYSESIIIDDDNKTIHSDKNEKDDIFFDYKNKNKLNKNNEIEINEKNNLYQLNNNKNNQIGSLSSSIDNLFEKTDKENYSKGLYNEENISTIYTSPIKEKKNIDFNNIYINNNIEEIKNNINKRPLTSKFHFNNLSHINNKNCIENENINDSDDEGILNEVNDYDNIFKKIHNYQNYS